MSLYHNRILAAYVEVILRFHVCFFCQFLSFFYYLLSPFVPHSSLHFTLCLFALFLPGFISPLFYIPEGDGLHAKTCLRSLHTLPRFTKKPKKKEKGKGYKKNNWRRSRAWIRPSITLVRLDFSHLGGQYVTFTSKHMRIQICAPFNTSNGIKEKHTPTSLPLHLLSLFLSIPDTVRLVLF